MKNTTLTAVLTLLLAAATATAGGPVFKYCDPLFGSTLCTPIALVFEFEEANDTTRYDSAHGVSALEPDGYNVGTRVGKLGSYAADFTGNENSNFRLPGIGSLGPKFWTLTAWVYPDVLGASGQVQTLLASDYKATAGTHVYLENVGGSLKLKVSVTQAEMGTVLTATSGTNLTVGAWNFIAVGASQWPTQYGQANLFAQVGNSTKGNTTLTFNVRAPQFETYLGARVMQPSGSRTPFDGGMDALYLFSDALNAAQLTNLYNSGSGKVFPFVD